MDPSDRHRASTEHENMRPGSPPRPATEPEGAESSTQTSKTRTDPATGAPSGGKPEAAG